MYEVFLRHPEKIREHVTKRLRLPQIYMLSFQNPPYAQERGWTARGKLPGMRSLRRWAATLCIEYSPFLALISHKGFGAAQPQWHKKAQEAWGLNNPPSPYEVACTLLTTKNAPWRRVVREATESEKLAISTLKWHLIGAPTHLQARFLQTTPARVQRLHAKAIKTLMENPKFAIWALSTDLRPLATNPTRTKAIVMASTGLLQREFFPNKTHSDRVNSTIRLWKTYREIQDHPYFKAQLLSGRAFKPIPRLLFSPGIVWPTREEKRIYESNIDGRYYFQDRLAARRRAVRKIKSFSPAEYPDP